MGVTKRHRACFGKLYDRRGQMTVEFAVAFPVFVIIAVVCVNALLFFADCASFDRLARDAVRVHAASPAYGQTLEDSRALVLGALEESVQRDNLSLDVTVESQSGGHAKFTATERFAPTLFGLGLKSSVFGVALPQLEHSVSMTIDCYKPGVLL